MRENIEQNLVWNWVRKWDLGIGTDLEKDGI